MKKYPMTQIKMILAEQNKLLSIIYFYIKE